jgi:hypothetical protein
MPEIEQVCLSLRSSTSSFVDLQCLVLSLQILAIRLQVRTESLSRSSHSLSFSQPVPGRTPLRDHVWIPTTRYGDTSRNEIRLIIPHQCGVNWTKSLRTRSPQNMWASSIAQKNAVPLAPALSSQRVYWTNSPRTTQTTSPIRDLERCIWEECWFTLSVGDATFHWTIILNGGTVDVVENLEAALHEISTQGRLFRIWVDTVCIN